MRFFLSSRWKMLASAVLLVAGGLLCQVCTSVYSGFEIKCDLPELPEGVIEAGDIELRADGAVFDVNIPGLTRRESKYGISYWKREAERKVSTLGREGARRVAAAFLERYFPGILRDREFTGCGVSRTSQWRDANGEHAVVGYSVYFGLKYRSVRVLNDKIGVKIEGDEVRGIDLAAYTAKEAGPRRRLLSACRCLAKAAGILEGHFESSREIVVGDVRLGYEGGFVQPWEDRDRHWSEPMTAFAVYKIVVDLAGARSSGGIFTFDARTGELIYPKRATGKAEVEIPGPELNYAEGRSYEIFIIGPRDVEIEDVVFKMESLPVESRYLTFSVRELFEEGGAVRISDSSSLISPRLDVDLRKDPNTIARGVLNVETPGEYEIDVLMRQYRSARHPNGQTVIVRINGEARELGDDGPVGHRLWERWGRMRLSAGDNGIEVLQGAGGSGRIEVGPVRLRRLEGEGSVIGRVKDLKIWFRQGVSADYYNCSPPTERFETDDLSSKFRSVFVNPISRGLHDRTVGSFTVSSTGTGSIRLHSVDIVFSSGEQSLAEEKAKQFVLIYPDGGASRRVSAEELEVFSTYLKNVIEARKRVWVHERLELCELGRRVASACEGGAARKAEDRFQALFIELVRKEAQALANSFGKTTGKPPRSPEFLSWGKIKSVWWSKMAYDAKRVTAEGTYLDPWGNVYVVEYLDQDGCVVVRSRGPNGKDDNGRGDDIVAEGRIVLMHGA
ncbi:MAG: hypothetical protein KAY65_09065 [Planctomycetes bacterium]|nr:hypothetical protein [Planctomycetota bacterium]